MGTAANPSTMIRQAPHYQPLVVVFVAVAAGIVADRVHPVSPVVGWGIAVAACVVWLALWRRGWSRCAAAALLLAAATAGGAWHHLRWYDFAADDLAEFTDEESRPAVVRGVALREPRLIPAPPLDPLRAGRSSERSRVELRLTAIRDGEHWRCASGNAVLMVQGALADIEDGDEIEIFAHASRMRSPDNPGQTDFAAHYRADRFLCHLQAKSPQAVTRLRRGSSWTATHALEVVRGYSGQMLARYLRHEQSGIAAALLLNEREQLDAQRIEAFLETNTIHYLAISGAHVAILAGALFMAMRWGLMSRRLALSAIALSATGYVLLTGSPPSALRSLVMVLLVCLALLVGRPASAFNCLGAGGIFVVVLNPADLFRIGAQLSFLAVGVLAWLGPRFHAWQQHDALDRLIASTRPWPRRAFTWLARWTWRTMSVTCIVWLVTLPLVMARFHLLSPIAIPLSPLMGLPIGVAMLSGFGVMLFGTVLPPLAWLCGWVCNLSLATIDWLVLRGSELPGSHFWVAGPDEWWLVGFYAGLALWVAIPSGTRYSPRARCGVGLGLLAAWIAAGFTVAWTEHRRGDRLECTFVSVGHGCGAVLELPDGQTILYDAGQLGSPTAGARSIAGFLWWRGITRLDAVVISHADADHYNALPLLLQQFSVGRVYISPVMFRDDRDQPESLALRTLRKSIERAGVPLTIVGDGDALPSAAGCTIRVLHPPADGVPRRKKGDDLDNAHSIVLAVEYAGQRMILPGDLEKAGLERLLALPSCDCDVLLAPHHGSANSNPPGMAAWCTPEWVVLTSGHDVSPTVLAAYEAHGARVLSTARDGAVRVRLTSGDVRVAHWHHGRFLEARRP